MIKIIRRIYSFLLGKKIFLPFLVFICLGIFFPLHPALAVWDWLVGTITFVPVTFFSLAFLLFASVASLAAALGGAILSYVISDNFTTLSYTNPANNEVIKVGLGITQGFVNMLLVLILVYIALATILRLAGYETKKLLITFVIVALLVNFSPLICGIIVDASNIVMNFFLSELTGSKQLINSFGAIWETIKQGFSWQTFNFTGQLDILFNFGVITVLNIALFLVLLLFAAIFIFRHIAIWILVILSPLAFACYILPATKKYWIIWWTQFIQWSIIGISCGFFLYLAELLMAQGTSVYAPAQGLGSAFMPHLVPLAFLWIGLIFGLQTSAAGASGVMGLTARAGRWVRGKTRKGIALGDRKWIPSVRKKEVGEETKWYKRLELTSPRKTARWATKGWEKVPAARWFRPEALKRFSETRPALESLEKEVTGPSDTEIERVANGKETGMQAAVRVWSIIKNRGDAQDLINVYMKKWGHTDKNKSSSENEKALFEDERFLNDKTLLNALDLIGDAGEQSKLLRISPRLARVIGKSKDQRKEKLKKALSDAKPSDITKWEKEEIEDPEVMEVLLAIGDENTYRTLGTLKGKVLARKQTINKVFTEWVKKEKRDINKNAQNTKAFLKHLADEYGVLQTGYEKAISSSRFKSAGWDETFHYEEGSKPTTAGEATIGSRPAEISREKPKDTGEWRQKKRNKPDVGQT